MKWQILVNSYLSERRKLGYKLQSEEFYLNKFAVFAEQQRADTLTIALALTWANQAPSKTDVSIARRCSILRPFSRYLICKGYNVELLPTKIIGSTHRRLPPFIFNNLDIANLMKAANDLYPPNGLRPKTIKALVGLLASSGLRPGEAVRLQTKDVNLENSEITIHNSKQWKKRTVPISLSTTEALQEYNKQRNIFNSGSCTRYFFEFDNYQPLNIRSADYAFSIIRQHLNLPNKLQNQPRLYDLRHTFVCQRLIKWYQEGEKINNKIAYLSYYLGHKKVSDTYWYITAIPELMHLASNKVNFLLKM